MKRSTVYIILSITILLLLVFRLLYKQIEGLKNEKVSFVHQLNYTFSTKIDSVHIFNHREFGLVWFHEITGALDPSIERRLNRKLKFNDDLRFIHTRPDDVFAIISFTADKYTKGDSLVIDTTNDRLTFYRGTEIISENKVTENLSGRPF